MALPPLYKYLNVRGAKLTLGNRTFRHSKPSDFNDIEDMTTQSIFLEETEVALKKLSNGFQDVILAHRGSRSRCCHYRSRSFARACAYRSGSRRRAPGPALSLVLDVPRSARVK
jgi:hypothetical protein